MRNKSVAKCVCMCFCGIIATKNVIERDLRDRGHQPKIKPIHQHRPTFNSRDPVDCIFSKVCHLAYSNWNWLAVINIVMLHTKQYILNYSCGEWRQFLAEARIIFFCIIHCVFCEFCFGFFQSFFHWISFILFCFFFRTLFIWNAQF